MVAFGLYLRREKIRAEDAAWLVPSAAVLPMIIVSNTFVWGIPMYAFAFIAALSGFHWANKTMKPRS